MSNAAAETSAEILTNAMIVALQHEAGLSGDIVTVETCEEALDGDETAMEECAKAITSARAMDESTPLVRVTIA